MLTRLSDLYDWPFADAGRSYSTLDQLRRQMERVFSEYERGSGAAVHGGARGVDFSRLTLNDEGAQLVLRAEMPGITEKDLEITANATSLTLRAERKDHVPEGYAVHRKERTHVKFARSFQLPCKVDPDKIEAVIQNGVLTLSLPKAAEARPKQITVKAN